MEETEFSRKNWGFEANVRDEIDNRYVQGFD